jgi:hypothetical protein
MMGLCALVEKARTQKKEVHESKSEKREVRWLPFTKGARLCC